MIWATALSWFALTAFPHSIIFLENPIPKKGEVLNKMSKFWFDFTKDVVPNHMISIDAADMPAFFRKPEFDGNSMKTQKLEMIPVECIVRGYITGSGWESYKKDGTICGIRLPEGLEECEKLPEAIFTPSTKAPVGEHDMNISMEEGEEWIERTFPGKGKEYMERLRDLTLALYRKCADYALSKALSLRTLSLNSAWIRKEISFSVMKC